MSKRETEILQIRKYLNGELDAHAMHRLEKQAQDDPFLMDALDGYEAAGNDQQTQLDELTGRLHQRINTKEKRIIPLWLIAVAASVLIVLSIGGYLLFNNKPVNNTQVAAVVKTDSVKTEPVAAVPAKVEKKADTTVLTSPLQPRQAAGIKRTRKHITSSSAVLNDVLASTSVKKEPDSSNNDAMPLNEMVVMGYSSQHKDAKTAANAPKANKIMEGRAPGLFIINNNSLSKRIVQGRVVSKDDGGPVIGASVVVPGTNTSAITDVNGRFSIAVDSNKNNLQIAYIGYFPQMINIRSTDSLKSITMVPNKASLAEVTIAGSASEKKAGITGSINKDSAFGDKMLNSRNAQVATPIVNTVSNGIIRNIIIKGRVISRNDGLPLPGASVKIEGSNKVTQTDIDGRFNLRADSAKSSLVIAFVGYQQRHINIRSRDSLQTIALDPAKSSLNEVVVIGYSGQKNNQDDAVISNAHPKEGWSSFKKYLKDNAVSPDGKTGVVKLSFIVENDGSINDIKIVKGLSVATDQKAIEMLNNGPEWAGSSTHKPEKVNIRIKFGK